MGIRLSKGQLTHLQTNFAAGVHSWHHKQIADAIAFSDKPFSDEINDSPISPKSTYLPACISYVVQFACCLDHRILNQPLSYHSPIARLVLQHL